MMAQSSDRQVHACIYSDQKLKIPAPAKPRPGSQGGYLHVHVSLINSDYEQHFLRFWNSSMILGLDHSIAGRRLPRTAYIEPVLAPSP